jgi:hypothetical protein
MPPLSLLALDLLARDPSPAVELERLQELLSAEVPGPARDEAAPFLENVNVAFLLSLPSSPDFLPIAEPTWKKFLVLLLPSHRLIPKKKP